MVSPYEVDQFDTNTISPSLSDQLGVGRALLAPKSRNQVGALTGTRPLLVILAQFPGVTLTTRHDSGYFDRLVFGSSTRDADYAGSVVNYFSNLSGDEFTWQKADTVGPFLLPDGRSGSLRFPVSNVVQYLSAAILAASNNGFDYARYDTNRDRKIDPYELGIIAFHATDAAGGNCGSTRRGSVVVAGGLTVSFNAVLIPEATGIGTVAHELIHALGAGMDSDIYGSGSNGSSLMAASCAGDDVHQRIQLDAWHKMRLGWTSPRLEAISPLIPGSSAYLNMSGAHSYKPLLFRDFQRYFDPNWQDFEMFLLEFRNATTANFYDSNARDNGVAAWYARMGQPYVPGEGDGEYVLPPTLPELIRETNCDSNTGQARWVLDGKIGQSLWIVSAPGQCRGLTPYWREEHGEARLRWYPRRAYLPRAGVAALTPVPGAVRPLGDDSGLRFKVGPFTSTSPSVAVEWRFNGNPILPRIDTRRGTLFYARSAVVLDGDFGFRPGKVVRIQSSGRSYDLAVSSWSINRITATLPDNVEPGSYSLRIFLEDDGDSSNAVPIEISRR